MKSPPSATDPVRPDTAARSLSHWSEAKRAEMDAFYVLADEDYRQLALAAPWVDVLGERARPGWRLLDVACGSGRFPRALLRFAGIGDADLPALPVDLLDPSAFSVHEAAGHLAAPFVVGRHLLTTLQDLPSDAVGYDIVWATHALYAMPTEALSDGAVRMVDALAPGVSVSSPTPPPRRTTCASMSTTGLGCRTPPPIWTPPRSGPGSRPPGPPSAPRRSAIR